MRVIGYIRVSTDEQARSGLGLEAQEATLRQAAIREGWDLVEPLIVDEGRSAKSLDRPGLMEAVTLIAAGEADAIAVAKLDRLTRSLVGLADLLEWSERVGASVIALDLGLDTTTSTGRLVARIMASVGEWEREQISSRTKAAAEVKRNKNERISRGSVRDSNPTLAKRIASLREAEMTWQAIADLLNEEKVPTIRGGACWRVSSVQAAGGYRRPASRTARVELPTPSRRRRR